MLGLGDYDSPIGTAEEQESPAAGSEVEAPAAAAPAAEEEKPPAILSIVDYFDDDKTEEPATAGFGISLDDDTVQRAAPRMVGGVQISVVKKTPPRPADPADSNGAPTGVYLDADMATATSEVPPFVLPNSPSGSVDQKLLEKFASLVDQTKKVAPKLDTQTGRVKPQLAEQDLEVGWRCYANHHPLHAVTLPRYQCLYLSPSTPCLPPSFTHMAEGFLGYTSCRFRQPFIALWPPDGR